MIEKSLYLYKNAPILLTLLQCYSKNASLSSMNMHLDSFRVLNLGKIISHCYVIDDSMYIQNI